MEGLGLFSYSTKTHQPRRGSSHSLRKCPNSLILRQHFLKWGSLLPDDSRLCQVDKRLASTLRWSVGQQAFLHAEPPQPSRWYFNYGILVIHFSVGKSKSGEGKEQSKASKNPDLPSLHLFQAGRTRMEAGDLDM